MSGGLRQSPNTYHANHQTHTISVAQHAPRQSRSEPLVHDELVDVVRNLAPDRNLISINTNGTLLTEAKARKLRALRVFGSHRKLYVTAYGDVIPCPFRHISFGDVRQDSLATIRDRMLSVPYLSNYAHTCHVAEDRKFIANTLSKTFDRTDLAGWRECFGEGDAKPAQCISANHIAPNRKSASYKKQSMRSGSHPPAHAMIPSPTSNSAWISPTTRESRFAPTDPMGFLGIHCGQARSEPTRAQCGRCLRSSRPPSR